MTNIYSLGTYSGISPLGVPLKFHWSTILLPLMLYINNGLFGMAMGVVVIASVIVHEYFHVFAALRRGFGVSAVMIFALGGAALIDGKDMDSEPNSELVIALYGPLGSLILAAMGFLTNLIYPNILSSYVFLINIVLAVFNMMPLYPMDGGRVLKSLLSMKFGAQKALCGAVYTTYVVGGIATALAAYVGNIWIAVMFIMVIIMAKKQMELSLAI